MPDSVSAPQAHSIVSNINFDIWIFFLGTRWISHEKLATDSKVLSQLGLSSNILFGPLTDISGFVGYYTTSLQQGVKYQLDIWIVFGGTVYISHEKLTTDGKVLSHLGNRSKIFSGPFNEISAWLGFCTSSPHQGVKYQLWYFDFFLEGLYKYPMKNWQWIAKFFITWGLDQRYCPSVNWLKHLGGYLYLKSTVGCQITTLIFGFFLEGPYRYRLKNWQRTAKFFLTWGLCQSYCQDL